MKEADCFYVLVIGLRIMFMPAIEQHPLSMGG
jgi:hypothetical protein